MIVTNPESQVFKKRAKSIAKYLDISVEEVMQSDKITTDEDMKECLAEKYQIPEFRELLLKTGNAPLHERPMRGKPNDWTFPGNDKLGKMLIEIRDEIKSRQNKKQ